MIARTVFGLFFLFPYPAGDRGMCDGLFFFHELSLLILDGWLAPSFFFLFFPPVVMREGIKTGPPVGTLLSSSVFLSLSSFWQFYIYLFLLPPPFFPRQRRRARKERLSTPHFLLFSSV